MHSHTQSHRYTDTQSYTHRYVGTQTCIVDYARSGLTLLRLLIPALLLVRCSSSSSVSSPIEPKTKCYLTRVQRLKNTFQPSVGVFTT